MRTERRKREADKATDAAVTEIRSYVPLAACAPRFANEWDLLPPLPEVIESVNKFTRYYFQLGFIPKLLFPERLRTRPRSVSVFLLLGILSISSRLTPILVSRYGSAVRAAEAYMDRAEALTQSELYKEPTLERCQGFYLLSIAQQGSGMKHKSSVRRLLPLHSSPSLTGCLDQHGHRNADGDSDAAAPGGNLRDSDPDARPGPARRIGSEDAGTYGWE